MNVLIYGIGLFIIGFFIHLFLWKVYLPKNQTRALLLVFFGTLMGGIFILPHQTMWQYLQMSFLFISLTLAYIASYPAIEVDSPSLVMILEIAKAGPLGLSKDAFKQKMNDNLLIIPRIKDLVSARMAYLDGQIYRLTPKGIFIARIFTAYRNLLKKAQKGG